MANVELVKAIKNGNVVTSLGELAAGDTVTMKGDGSTVAGALALNNAANTSSTTLQSGAVTSNVTFRLPDAVGSTGQVLKVSSVPDASTNVLTWGADTEGIALTALSVTTGAASGSGTLSYDNTSGVFTFAPADLSGISSDLVNDTTPQLGGNLDVNGQSIVSVTNGNISILPDGTGSILLDGDGTVGNGGVTVENGIVDVKNAGTVSKIRLYCENTNAHFTELVSDAHINYTDDVTLTLPTTSGTVALTSEIPTTLTDLSIADGTSGQVLSTNGSGSFSFTTISVPTTLTDLSIADGTSGQVLSTNGSGSFSFTTISTATQLDALTDVDATSSVGQVLQSDGDGTYSFVSPSASGAASITSGTINNVAIGGTTSFNTTGTVKLAGCYPFGANNIILGSGAGSSLTDTNSPRNVVVGVNAADSSTRLEDSVVIGYGSLNQAVNTYSNVAVGAFSMIDSTTSGQVGLGWGSLGYATTGCCNIALGTYGLFSLTTGSNNTTIGYLSGNDSLCQITTQSNHVILGNNTTACLLAKVQLTVPSDCRDKTDIADIPYGLNLVQSICPVAFKFDDRGNYEEGVTPDGTHKENKCRIGFLAQNVISAERSINPTGQLLVTNDEREDRFSITETNMIPVLVKAIQELTQRIEQLEMA